MAKAKYMLVIKSDEVDEALIKKIRKEFKRNLKKGKTPIFAMGKDDSIEVIRIRK